MIHISRICEDWITKGCHIHVGSVELAVRPDHRGGMVMKKVFASTSEQDAEAAVRLATAWLADIQERRHLFRELLRARDFLRGDWGALTELASGRGAELTFLMAALERLGI
jgi:hypothetical protein